MNIFDKVRTITLLNLIILACFSVSAKDIKADEGRSSLQTADCITLADALIPLIHPNTNLPTPNLRQYHDTVKAALHVDIFDLSSDQLKNFVGSVNACLNHGRLLSPFGKNALGRTDPNTESQLDAVQTLYYALADYLKQRAGQEQLPKLLKIIDDKFPPCDNSDIISDVKDIIYRSFSNQNGKIDIYDFTKIKDDTPDALAATLCQNPTACNFSSSPDDLMRLCEALVVSSQGEAHVVYHVKEINGKMYVEIPRGGASSD